MLQALYTKEEDLKYLSFVIFFFTNSSFAESPATPYISNNPNCQVELTERETVWANEYELMISDIVVNLHLRSLMELRRIAIDEQSIPMIKQIDKNVSDELLHTLKFRPKALNYKSQLTSIKQAIELEPLMVSPKVRENVYRAFEAVGV